MKSKQHGLFSLMQDQKLFAVDFVFVKKIHTTKYEYQVHILGVGSSGAGNKCGYVCVIIIMGAVLSHSKLNKVWRFFAF